MSRSRPDCSNQNTTLWKLLIRILIVLFSSICVSPRRVKTIPLNLTVMKSHWLFSWFSAFFSWQVCKMSVFRTLRNRLALLHHIKVKWEDSTKSSINTYKFWNAQRTIWRSIQLMGSKVKRNPLWSSIVLGQMKRKISASSKINEGLMLHWPDLKTSCSLLETRTHLAILPFGNRWLKVSSKDHEATFVATWE